jgi:hypothetical protein
VDPRGDVDVMKASKEDILRIVLHREALDDFRAKFPVGDDADDFALML